MGNGGKIPKYVIGYIREKRHDKSRGSSEESDGVTIRLGIFDVGDSDCASRSRFVNRNQRLSQKSTGAVYQGATRYVSRSSGRKIDDKINGLGWVFLSADRG